ncbi:DUF1643 domain-containing protein [Flavobacterium urumqiense]|uniref:DUF1643 domain-containing protein n=1 Tax=Flavobacterium urumqiense TaxID=935224 RepID=A0A1H6AI61_9FLAO|nr:DUF1643 domain-containing protein [Flavobacterium urumqiense]SEG47767.1 Protein of unknown function [Flavobacterium urumqiense]
MREDFNITGLFYENQGYKFRKFLNIVKKDSNCQIPDLMVVMMNPGGSRPINGYDDYKIETETIPDRTQDQIMVLMNNCKFNYARILNLSDFREPKSRKFYNQMDDFETKNIHHSIFCEERKEDFNKLFIKDIPVIFAWGVNRNLFELAALAKERIGLVNVSGLKKEGEEYAYYHPLPQTYNKQKEWVINITETIKA